MIKPKSFLLFVLAILVLAQCNIGLPRRIITNPCALEIGPNFRCISPVNCRVNLTELVICGPNGIGICCPVISFHSPARCGIRNPIMRDPFPIFGYPSREDVERHLAYTSFTQSMFGQRLITPHNSNYDPFGYAYSSYFGPRDGKYGKSKSSSNRNQEETLASSDSARELHFESPLVRVSPQNTNSDSPPNQDESPKKRSLDEKPEIENTWFFPQDDLELNSSDSFDGKMEEYLNMVTKIELLIRQIGGMDAICKLYPGLAQILSIQLNKKCPPDQPLNISSLLDRTTIGQKEEDSPEKYQEGLLKVRNSPILIRNRRQIKETESNWKELYLLSREYLRKLVQMLVTDQSGETLTYRSLSELPLYPPFSTKQLQKIIAKRQTIVDKKAAIETTKSNGEVPDVEMRQRPPVIGSKATTNQTFKSDKAPNDSTRKLIPIQLSNKSNSSGTSKDTVQPKGKIEEKGRVDGKNFK